MSTATLHGQASVNRAAPAAGHARFPRLPLFGAMAFVAFSVVAILFAQTTGVGTVRVERSEPLAVRDIVIEESAGDVLRVRDAITQELVASFDAGQGGFVRGSMRAFNRMRLVDGVAFDKPYRVIKWRDGSVSLSDTGTGERFYLHAFGKDNADAFAALLQGHGNKGE